MKNLLLLSMTFIVSLVMAQAPTNAPTAPSVDEANVISIYSEAYTNVATNDWNPNWGQTTELEFQTIAENEVAVYNNLNFTGIEPTATIDISGHTHFNVTYWTEATNLKVKLVDWGDDGAWSGGDDTEDELEFTPTSGEWNYLSIAIADFAGMTATEHFAQLIFSTDDAGATVYIDDIYFSTDGGETTSSNKILLGSNINVYPNPASDIISIEYAEITEVRIYNSLGQEIITQSFDLVEQVSLDISQFDYGIYFVTIDTPKGMVSSKFLVK